MFDWLIPSLIVIVLLIKILDFLDLLDLLELVASVVSLIVGAIMLTAKLLVRLVRHLLGAAAPRSQA